VRYGRTGGSGDLSAKHFITEDDLLKKPLRRRKQNWMNRLGIGKTQQVIGSQRLRQRTNFDWNAREIGY
jgi:excinuclease UvrABC helicase subunit UvrB